MRGNSFAASYGHNEQHQMRFVSLLRETIDIDVPPGLPAAEGYAAGCVLGAAVRAAGTFSQESVRAALAELELPTVLGDYRVAPDSGAQIGAKPRVIQIRRGRPEPGLPLLPYPQWYERALIK